MMYGPMRRKLYSLCHCWCSKQRIEIHTKYIFAFHFFELFLQDSGSVLQHVTHKDDIPTLRPPVQSEHAKCHVSLAMIDDSRILFAGIELG
jgi:hypothetical protein